jgi:hypothetical protein
MVSSSQLSQTGTACFPKDPGELEFLDTYGFSTLKVAQPPSPKVTSDFFMCLIMGRECSTDPV